MRMRHSILLAIAVLGISLPASALAQQRGGAGVTGGAGGGGANATNRTEAGAVNTAAGSSEQIDRDFGDGLVGRGDTANRFVGNAAAGPQTGQVQAPTNFQNLNRQRAQQSRPPGNPIRARLVLGFDPKVFAPSGFSFGDTAVARRALSNTVPGVTYTLADNGTARLAGRAETARDRKLAEALLRLEPGVRRVNNDIVIDSVAPPLP